MNEAKIKEAIETMKDFLAQISSFRPESVINRLRRTSLETLIDTAEKFLALTNLPLDEKEVEKFIKTYDQNIWECVISAYKDTGCWSGLWTLLETISRELCSHFSKSVIPMKFLKMNFEQYLAEVHADQYVGTKDCMIDDFNKWVQDLGVDELIELGNRYHRDLINIYDNSMCKLNGEEIWERKS